MQALWRMVLMDLMPPAEGASLPGLLCVHWLLDRDFFSESESCSTCSKSGTDLFQASVEDNISTYTGAYACNFLEGRWIVNHLVALLMDTVTSVSPDKAVQQPGEAPREIESFSLSRSLSALTDIYPQPLCCCSG